MGPDYALALLAMLDPARAPRHEYDMTDQASPSGETAPQSYEQVSFEQALRALEDIVRRLESGEVPLDASITLYEEGERLRKLCQARLDAAQARIERIVAAPDGAITTQPFDPVGP